MIVTIGKDGAIPIEKFKDLVDITKVVYYRFTVNRDKTLTLKFYDKKKKLIKLDTSKSESIK